MAAILYLRDYKADEQQIMMDAGLCTDRLHDEEPNNAVQPSLQGKGPVFVRGPRLSKDGFERIWKLGVAAGVDFVTTPQSFEIAGEFALHHSLLRELSPPALALSGHARNEELFGEIAHAGLTLPIFVRSEVESAAKYVGVERCVLRELDRGTFNDVVDSLRNHVRNFDSFIFKEMWPVATADDGCTRLEYRAIGARGELLTFDLSPFHHRLPSPESLGLLDFVNRALHALAEGGASGAIFVDVAVTAQGRPLVIECKDFMNGSIMEPTKLARAILSSAACRASSASA